MKYLLLLLAFLASGKLASAQNNYIPTTVNYLVVTKSNVAKDSVPERNQKTRSLPSTSTQRDECQLFYRPNYTNESKRWGTGKYTYISWNDKVEDTNGKRVKFSELVTIKNFQILKTGKMKGDGTDNWLYKLFAGQFFESKDTSDYTATEWFYLATLFQKGWKGNGSNVRNQLVECLLNTHRLLPTNAHATDRIRLSHMLMRLCKQNSTRRDAVVKAYNTQLAILLEDKSQSTQLGLLAPQLYVGIFSTGKEFLINDSTFHLVFKGYVATYGSQTSVEKWKAIREANAARLTQEECKLLNELMTPSEVVETENSTTRK